MTAAFGLFEIAMEQMSHGVPWVVYVVPPVPVQYSLFRAIRREGRNE